MTIEAIHAAGLDPELWPQALGAMTRVVGGSAASLEVFDRNTLRHCEMYSSGLPRPEEIEYVEHYAPLNIRLPFVARQKLHQLSWDYLIVDENAMKRAPFYAEFMHRMDIRYYVGGIVLATNDEFAGVCVHRPARHGHIQREGIALMQRLVPHVQQAFDVTRRLKDAAGARSSLERALDWLADGVALLAADGLVLHANETLQAIARQNDGIAIRRGMLEVAEAEARSRVDAAIATARRVRSGHMDLLEVTDFLAARPSGAPPYLVSMRPLLGTSADENGVASKAVAIAFIRDPRGRSAANIRIMREIFGFTEAEASLAQALQAGLSLRDYARTRAVSVNTVYTHLYRIKEKTGCRHMSDLIRKLNDLQVPLRIG